VNAAVAIDRIRFLISLFWLGFQFYIVFYPQVPMIQRTLHLALALVLVILWRPLSVAWIAPAARRAIDAMLVVAVAAALVYYLTGAQRLTERMENIDPVLPVDVAIGIALLVVMLEAVRRVVGWSLLGVILVFLVYFFAGPLFPGWLRFQGFGLLEAIEILTMTSNGVLGITTETSVLFVFYFVTFGAIYSAIGGGQLFIDIGLLVAGRQKGGAAKAAVISSSLMGSISGSAVANVTATGVFTIPLMRRSGLDAANAAATEAIASTGGQLMPPIMGVAAFVMAELLQMDYARIALAGIIPAVAFYFAIFLYVDFQARRTGRGTLSPEEVGQHAAILPRLHLLIPPVVLIGVLVVGYSATFAAVSGCIACFFTAYLKRDSWLGPGKLYDVVRDATRQAAEVAVPIAAIGIIIAVAIQSNLALKFSTRLIEISGGTLYGAMFFIILGSIIMGMGLPTVAAYIIGAILFVPALLELGITELPAHFFVMYYSVLSMVTPPVALASYTAAGLARANAMTTSLLAFKISLVSFFIPFAFAFDPALLGIGDPFRVALAAASLLAATGAWAVALVGHINSPVTPLERVLFAGAALVTIFNPSETPGWTAGLVAIAALFAWRLVRARLAARAA
jgi:TRAP transporter 4TM/12TM fusion protein